MESELIASLDAAHVRFYLEHHSWLLTKSDASKEIWTSPRQINVILPRERREDYVSLVAQLSERIAADEARSTADVLIDLGWPGWDKLTARTRIDQVGSAVPIQEAVGLTGALRDLIVAAARSSESRLPSFRGGWSAAVGEYFDRVQMIPSTPGSFTLRALLPINPEPPEALLIPSVDTSRIRAVTRTLLSGVRAATAAARERVGGASNTVFDDAVAVGVSADLLDALVRLGGTESDASSVELSVAWTYAAPEAPAEPVRIEAGILPVLAEGADHLRSTQEDVVATLTGLVVRLHREPNLGAGEVTITGYFDSAAGSSTRSVKMQLDEITYGQAIAAHRDGATVQVRCVVQFGGPRLVVNSVRSFVVLPPD